jgi:hypothetical protein
VLNPFVPDTFPITDNDGIIRRDLQHKLDTKNIGDGTVNFDWMNTKRNVLIYVVVVSWTGFGVAVSKLPEIVDASKSSNARIARLIMTSLLWEAVVADDDSLQTIARLEWPHDADVEGLPRRSN